MVIFRGRQKLRAASRAGAAAPGPSGPALALPARGRRQGRRAAFGTCPARGRGGGPRPNAWPRTSRGNQSLSGRAGEKSRILAPLPASQVEWPTQTGQARPVARRPPGQPRALEGGRRRTKRLASYTGRPRFLHPGPERGGLKPPGLAPAGWRPSPVCSPARRTQPALSHRERLCLSAILSRKPCEPQLPAGPRSTPANAPTPGSPNHPLPCRELPGLSGKRWAPQKAPAATMAVRTTSALVSCFFKIKAASPTITGITVSGY